MSLKRQTGFTIVELLIVIVVIAVLAAISVIAYTGIQNRAADAAVQSDLRSIATKIRLYYVDNDTYPNGGANTAFPAGITHTVNRQAYDTNGVNLYYCTVHTGSNARFALAARSKSGNVYAYYNGGFQDFTAAFTESASICPGVGIPTSEANYEFHYGHTSAGVWSNWTN